MASYRHIHTNFWSDSFVIDLTPEQKYFYLYLLTNEKTRQCGIYEITKRQISFDTGYNVDTINKLIVFFTDNNKIIYSEETSEVCLINWSKHNFSNSPKVQSCIIKELKLVKNRVLIQYLYSMDTQSQEKEKEKEKEKRKESNKEKIPIVNKSLKELCNDFAKQNPNKYSKELYLEFVTYWTEKNIKNSKERWQSQDFFEVGTRLAKWFNNQKTEYAKTSQQPQTNNSITGFKSKPYVTD